MTMNVSVKLETREPDAVSGFNVAQVFRPEAFGVSLGLRGRGSNTPSFNAVSCVQRVRRAGILPANFGQIKPFVTAFLPGTAQQPEIAVTHRKQTIEPFSTRDKIGPPPTPVFARIFDHV